MTRVRDFVADLVRARKGFLEIKKTVDTVYGDKALKKTAIYAILKKVKAGENTDDQRHLNPKKRSRTPYIIAAVAASIEQDRRQSVKSLAAAHGVSVYTIHGILHKDLGLEKKSARWVPKLLSDEQKEERVRTSRACVAAVQSRSMAMLQNIVTMDETMVCHHTPQTKKQSMQWVKKGQPGPLKAQVHASRTKQMLLAFFDSKGLIYRHIVPKGSAVNGKYIVKALGNFLKQLKKKRPEMMEQEWWFHWDNAPVHTAAVVKEWFAAHNIQRLEHPPYSPDLASADFFLFRRVKKELAGRSLDEGTLKKTWEGVTRNIAAEEFATAFRRWYEHCEKCVRIGGGYVEKT
jgi:histone-lysine N-methyltransferase SETMAR